MRGELIGFAYDHEDDDGSSPLARGTHGQCVSGYIFLRFIPACAGNSVFGVVPKSAGAVHPRLRGELESDDTKHAKGSSPLARGTHLKWL